MARGNSTRNRMGNEQIEALICYMEEHSLFARGQICKLGAQGNIKYKKMWHNLTNLLNSIGPAQKDVAAWQKSWTSLRLAAKSNKIKYIKAMLKTGHNPPNIELSDNDHRISEVYGKYGSGMQLGSELGFNHVQRNLEDNDLGTELEFNHVERNLEDDEDFQYDSLLTINQNSFVNSHLQRFLDTTPSRINLIFEGLNQNLFHILELYKKKIVQKKKPTESQIQCLIEFMERHPDLANGVAVNAAELWAVLLTLLNNSRGVVRTEQAWKKTWSGLVTAARQSMRFLIDGRKETAMSNNHIKIIDIVGYREDNWKSNVSSSHQLSISSSSLSGMALKNEDETGNRNWFDTEPSTSSCTLFAGPSTSSSTHPRFTTGMNWYDRPSTSSSSICSSQSSKRCPLATTTSRREEPRATATSKREVPPPKIRRLVCPEMPQSFTADQVNAAGSSAPSSASAVVEKSKMIQALEIKGQELVNTLANHLISCFEKQNDALNKGFQGLCNTLAQTLPKIIAEEFTKTLKNNSNKEEDSVQVASGTVGSLLSENNEENENDEVFQLIEASVMAAQVPAETCTICQDEMVNPKKMECQHNFCNECINMWLQHSNCCPICRTSVRTLEDNDKFIFDELELDSEDNL